MPIKIYVSKTLDGSMKLASTDDITRANQTRARFLQNNGIDPSDTTLVRVKFEGNNYKRYLIANDSLKGDGIVRESTTECDAIVTTDFKHALFLPLADCIGTVIYDEDKHLLMVSHLGRHSLEQFGGTTSINYLIEKFSVDPKNLKIWLSPSAGKESYPLFTFSNRSLHQVAFEQLTNAGVLPKNIEVSLIDSAKSDEYFSHSQFLKGNQATDGRFAIVAYMTR
jgi:copper oxidase (laccase) domain-containing protein